jgi:UDP-N-acetylglucosamine 2-epimerase (non-hydrolysing)
MSIAIILGTSPEIIKMATVIRECQRRSLDYSAIHTIQCCSPPDDLLRDDFVL